MFYLLDFPRPIGLCPYIHTYKPDAQDGLIEVIEDDGTIRMAQDPYQTPAILEFKTMREALDAILYFNCTDDYLKNIKIVEAE